MKTTNFTVVVMNILRSGSNDKLYETASDEDIDYDCNHPVHSSVTNGMRPLMFEKEERVLIPMPGEIKPIFFF